MHIMEGFLPMLHAAAWTAVSAPFIGYGVWRLTKELRNNPQARLLLGAAGGFAFILSALKIPSVTGSCSHPTGVGLGTVLFGPGIMSVLGSFVLLFQALLLAHGGLTTLGANIFSMAVVGCYVAWGVFRAGRGIGLSLSVCVFLAAALSNVCTYLTTSAQLAMAFPDPVSGLAGSFAKFAGIFALTQLPLAVSEGLLSVLVMNLLVRHGQPELRTLPHVKEAIA